MPPRPPGRALCSNIGWRRPRRRLYPAKPKLGIRASKPNEYWHIDVTVIRLLDATRTYLHALIDHFSRRILAWKLVLRLEPQTTCQVLIEAAKNLPMGGDGATVVADSGGENVNHEVDDLLGLGQLRRILALVEVSFSNSMIEAWWRSLTHGWLYLHQLHTFADLERLISRARAREARMKYNRSLSCEACRPPVRDTPRTSDSSAVSSMLQMHDEMSVMS